MKPLFSFAFIVVSFYTISQITCSFEINNSTLKTGEKVQFNNDTSWIQIDELKFYIQYSPYFSDEKINGGSVIHLIDVNDSLTYQLPFTEDGAHTNSTFQFAIGIDSVSTMQTQFSGALDPSLGMYWAWNTGYIHFKLEGKSNLSKERNNEFQLHIGGYSLRNNTQRWLETNLQIEEGKPKLIFDLTNFVVETVNLQKSSMIMIPGIEAVKIANGFHQLVKP
jgi:hypothetical protein